MQPHYFPLLGRFLWVYLVALIVIGGITGALGLGSVGGFVPLMVAAMDGGGRFVKRAKRAPTSGEKWALATMHALVSLLVAIPFLLLLLAVSPELGQLGGAMMVIVAVAIVINMLICRVFVWLGARNMMKKMGPTISDAEVFQ